MLKHVRAARGELTPEDLPTARLLFLVSPPPPSLAPVPVLPPAPMQEDVGVDSLLITGQVAKLFDVAEVAASRSSKDVFPFHLKEVEAFHQLAKIREAVEMRLRNMKASPGVPGREALEALGTVLRDAVGNPEIDSQVRELEQINAAFCEVRRILGQEGKPGEVIRGEVHHYLASLASTGVPEFARAEMEKRFHKYDRELYVAYDNQYVPRTNNNQEDFNNGLKRYIRKGQGKMNSWFHVEHQGIPTAYYQNLVQAAHVVGGTSISSETMQSPLERTGTLPKLSVTEVMSHVNIEYWRKIQERNDRSYAVHRWTRKICRQGIDACLKELDDQWNGAFAEWQSLKATGRGYLANPD